MGRVSRRGKGGRFWRIPQSSAIDTAQIQHPDAVPEYFFKGDPAMTAAQHRTVEGMAAAAERIGEELIRAKDKIASSAADAGDDLAAELRRLQHDLNAVKETIADFGQASGAEASGAAS